MYSIVPLLLEVGGILNSFSIQDRTIQDLNQGYPPGTGEAPSGLFGTEPEGVKY